MPDRTEIQVLRPGLLTTVQDLGRPGYQRDGVPASGALDTLALRVANRLVGNQDHAAALEATLQGPDLLFERDAVIAVTGGNLSPCAERAPLPMWTAVAIRGGTRVSFGARREGARAYLAVSGGLAVPKVLGSRSTHLRSRTGGLQGRALATGDMLLSGKASAASRGRAGKPLPPALRPAYGRCPTLRVIPGPQLDHFTPDALERLGSGPYVLTPQSDRMGYRLHGPALPHTAAADIVSDATPAGALQVPAARHPILLLADRQTTGGYPKIAVVITADLPLAGQLAPEDALRFVPVEIRAAHAILRRQWGALDVALPPID